MSHHFNYASLGLHDLVLAATAKTKTSSYSSLIFIVFIVLVGYFLLIRPQRQRAKRQQAQVQEIGVGDQVMLTSGIIGRVVGFNGDRARLEISDGVEIEVVRRAIAQRMSDEDGVEDVASEPSQPDPGAEDDDGEYPHASDDPGHEVPAGEYEDDETDGTDAEAEAGSWPATAVHPDPDSNGVPGGGLSDGDPGSSDTGSGTGKV